MTPLVPSSPGRVFPYPILFRDNRFLVVNKPPGLPVHGGPRGGASVEDSFAFLPRHSRGGPWLAHRLDADTAGCLVIALRKQALLAAQDCFAHGRAAKTYWAVVEGQPQGQFGQVDIALSRVSNTRGWRMVADAAGALAATQWRMLGTDGRRSWLELTLLSGRTHQARVHCAWLGCPVVGDPVYGAGGPPLNLLARRIALPLDPPVVAVAPPPAHMVAALGACGYR